MHWKLFLLVPGILLGVALLCACTEQDKPASSSSRPVSSPGDTSGPEPASSGVLPEEDSDEDEIKLTDYLPADDLPPYQIIPITEQRYEGQYYAVEFVTLPKTDAETLVCDQFYGWVMGEGRIIAAQQWPGLYGSTRDENYDTVDDGTEWIRVDEVRELTSGEAAGLSILTAYHKKYGTAMSYGEYMDAIYNTGCKVVQADYEVRYTDEKRQQGPQLADGEMTVYWMLVPDDDGNLKLFADTRIFGEYSMQPFEELVPTALIP